LAYLRRREQVTGVYREVMRSIWLEDDARRRVRAMTYVVDRSHPQYSGPLSIEEQFHHVAHSQGKSGANRDYVISTVKALEARGCRDPQLHHLAALLQGDTPMHR
ncbi:MAG TPA: gamma-glutamylcyclotransferase, partial [Afipia sp.]